MLGVLWQLFTGAVYLLIQTTSSVLCLRPLRIRKAGILHCAASRQQNSKCSPVSHPRLSKPFEELQACYDVVVVGSGYGASIAASRLARAHPKQSVCVLERGLERWPAEFPSTPNQALRELHVKRFFNFGSFQAFLVKVGRATGLYHLSSGPWASVFSGNGLGGTGLLNVNVWLKPDDAVLQAKDWPAELREAGALDKYYTRAESMLEPKTFPYRKRRLRKYDVLRQQATAVGLGESCRLVQQMTSFEDCVNAAGVQMRASTMSGQDSLGLNDGSKNTTLVTYLTDAWSQGADIFCGCNVRFVKPHPHGGYTIFFQRTGLDSRAEASSLEWIRARKLVFLGAGSLGSTEIILRSKDHGLSVSSQAGERLSGNGSMLAFGYGLSARTNALGKAFPASHAPGPTICGVVECNKGGRMEHRFILQEGTFPMVMATLFRIVHWILPGNGGRPIFRSLLRRIRFGIGRSGDILDFSQVYLIMGHDSANGRLSLQNDQPVLDMRGVSREDTCSRMLDTLESMTLALGGVFKQSGFKVLVHPLGGMSMTTDGTGSTGATSHACEVFAGDDAKTHKGLCVIDGAVIPRSLAANPAATICAIAERSVDLIARERGLEIEYSLNIPTKRSMKAPKAAARGTVSFSETMFGDLLVGKTYAPLRLDVAVRVARNGTKYEGTMRGTLYCVTLSDQSMQIRDGKCTILEQDESAPNQVRFVYLGDVLDTNGNLYRFRGVKILHSGIAFSLLGTWKAATRLQVSMSTSSGKSLRGTVRIALPAFIRQLCSIKIEAAQGTSSIQVSLDFARHFVSRVAHQVFLPLMPLIWPPDVEELRGDVATRAVTQADHQQLVTSSDGVESSLQMWKPRTKPASFDVKHVLLIPGAAVSHLMFATLTLETNFVDYITERGYACWILTHRLCKKSDEKERNDWTAYDARLDIRAALKAIRGIKSQATSRTRPYVVAHCAGSIALGSGLLDGTISSEWLVGMTASGVFIHPILSPANRLKARLRLISFYARLLGNWFAMDSTRNAALLQRFLDQILRFYPVGAKRQLCNSSTYHRIQLAIGLPWQHENLNAATHDQLHRVFGGFGIPSLRHLIQMDSASTITDNEGRTLVIPANIQRLRALPMLLITGTNNGVYSLQGLRSSTEALRSNLRSQIVKFAAVSNLNHLDCWMSQKASEENGFFDTIEKELASVFGSQIQG